MNAKDDAASYHNLDEVLKALEDGTLVAAMIPHAMMDFLDESNVDQVISGLPGEYRTFVLEWAHGAVTAPEHELLNLAGVSNLTEIRHEDTQHPREEAFYHALRSWFDRHPWPEPT